MKRLPSALLALAAGLLLTPVAIACGEGIFNMGQGLRYQGYLTPRPAHVLIYDADPAARRTVYVGLHRAGHHLTLARNPQELATALQDGHFDVVISMLERADEIEAQPAGNGPQVLPVVQRQMRNTPQVRERYRVFVLDGASLGQYLKGIDQLVKGRT